MGRMFRIVTEGPLDAVIGGAAPKVIEKSIDAEMYVGGNAPFIEVGSGTAVTNLKAVPRPEPKPAELKHYDPMTVTPLPPPRAKEFLSVALHEIPAKPAAPVSPIAADVVAFHQPDHAISHEYRILANELKKQVGVDGPKSVLFTATARDHGTTTVLLNLAVTLAREPGQRVLVLDADFEHPTAARKLGLSDLPGLGDVLAQTMPLAWVIQPTAVPKLQVLGSGRLTTEHHATLAVDLPRIITQLRQWFDWILVDGGLWGERPNATAPARPSTGCIWSHAPTTAIIIRDWRSRFTATAVC